jgi:hydroxyacylglutathione hydrolase
MLQIKQFRYAADNLGYLVYGRRKAMAIDGGAVSDILTFIENNQLELLYIANTHSHPDHTGGNDMLLAKTSASLLDSAVLTANGVVELEDTVIQVMHTPGHTRDSICFYFNDTLISGDTLFNGKAGRCFTGDHAGFLQSIKKILKLPEETRLYAGHDYVFEYIEFSRRFEPDNPHIADYLKKYDPGNLFYTLAEEIRINPYLRINDAKVTGILEQRGLPAGTEADRWHSMLSLM